MLLADLAATSAAVAATTRRSVKVGLLAACLGRLRPEEVPIAAAYLAGDVPQGALGVGWAALHHLPGTEATEPSVPLLEVDAILGRIGGAAGPGSQSERQGILAGLFARLTAEEQQFLRGVLSGGLRQGALAGLMLEAVIQASGLPGPDIRRAVLVSGRLAPVAQAALGGGLTAAESIRAFRPILLRPVAPMLAQTAADPEEALSRTGPAAVEWKLDGVRVQVHRARGEVAVFTRSLADATERLPDVVAAVRALPGGDLILDGELIALGADGRPRRFQETMGRFGTSAEDVPARAVGLSPVFVDCLHVDGRDLLDAPGTNRFAALRAALPPGLVIPRIETGDPARAGAFLDAAIAAGHEGVMVKSLTAPYAAGRRGAGWLKVKRAWTLDLVVLAAEWGHGRRQGWLSNLHLGARSPGGFVMLGKTFKGMTDDLLAWQTAALLARETGRSGNTVHVQPELVVEVAFDGVQASTRYPGGMALRFARIRGYRGDKGPDQADTIDTVRAIYEGTMPAR